MDLTTLNQTRTVDVQIEVRHAASYRYARVKGTNFMNVDSFIDVGHGLDRQGSFHMDLFNSKWTDCSILETSGIVDLQ